MSETTLFHQVRDHPGPAGPAAARRRGVPAHGHPAVRRPREIHPRARRGDEGRQAHHADRAEAAGRRRSQGRRPVPHRHRRHHPAAAQATRRHRQGAGRGRGPRAHRRPCTPASTTRADVVDRARRRHLRREGTGRARAFGDLAVRAVREAQQEGAARGAHRAGRHRAARPPGRHRRRAHGAQAAREAEGSGDPRRAQAPRARAGRHRRRDGRAADREAHPRPREVADGEEPARVLPE